MSETLCDWSKRDIAQRTSELVEILRQPRFYCRKCARAACAQEYLCKPEPLRLPPRPRDSET